MRHIFMLAAILVVIGGLYQLFVVTGERNDFLLTVSMFGAIYLIRFLLIGNERSK